MINRCKSKQNVTWQFLCYTLNKSLLDKVEKSLLQMNDIIYWISVTAAQSCKVFVYDYVENYERKVLTGIYLKTRLKSKILIIK